MKLYRLFILSLIASTTLIGCGDDENDYNLGGYYIPPQPNGNGGSGNSNDGDDKGNNDADVANAIKRLEFPRTSSKHNSFVVVHNALLNMKTKEHGINYCVEWDPEIRAQRWCCYQMYGKVTNGIMSGTNGEYANRYNATNDGTGSIYSQYPNDTCIAENYRFTKDAFKGSGYDHGHICPSADRLGSDEANYQTFFLTNMMPQVNSFNAGIWAAMEAKLRDWTKSYDTLYVCKGGTIDKDEHIISYIGSGDNKIPVPKYFFMAILGVKNKAGQKGDYSAMAFWIEHKGNTPKNDDLKKYMVNVRELEKSTNIDFFCNLSDDIEEWVETLPLGTIQTQWIIK